MNSIGILGIALLISVTVFFFGPLEMLLTQSGAFHFDISTVWLPVVLVSLVAFVFLYFLLRLVQRIKPPLDSVFTTLFFFIGILLYLQGNWFFSKYGIMDGTAIDWGKFKGHAIANTLVWCVPPVVACFLSAVGRRIPRSVMASISFGIVGLELLSLLALATGKLASGGLVGRGGYQFTSKGQFQLSSDHDNVLIVCADSFDGNQFSPVLESEPELREAFDGFTFFPDTLGTSLYSEDSVITLLTGNQYHLLNAPFADNVSNAWENSFFDGVLDKYGYSTSIYLHKGEVVSDAFAPRIKNVKSAGAVEFDMPGLCATLYKMVMFKYAPHVLKKRFWYTTMDFDHFRRDVFPWDNIDFWRLLREKGISCAPTDGNVFHFYWIKGAHAPFTMSRRGEPVGNDVFRAVAGITKEEVALRFEQTVGVARLFANIVSELKAKGIYDRTLVIFTADHGGIVRPNPLLLVKPRGSRGPMHVSMAPISMIKDWKRSFEFLVGGDAEKTGETIFDIPESGLRDRPFYVYELDLAIDRRYNQKIVRHYMAGEMLKRVPRFAADYNLGDAIFIADNDGMGCKELDPDGTPFVWSRKTVARIPLKVNGKFNNLRLDMDVSTFNGSQSFRIQANNYLVAEGSACGRSHFAYVIPRSAIGDDGLVTLRFDLPGAISPHSIVGNGDVRTIAIKFYSLTLSPTDQKVEYEYSPGTRLSFAEKEGATALDYCCYGFSHSEPNFTWTSGDEAAMRFAICGKDGLDKEKPFSITLHYRTFLPEEHVALSANGRPIAEYLARGEETRTFQVPPDAVSSNGVLDLVLRLPDATSPYSQGKGRDKRLLALRLFDVLIQ